MSEHLSKERLEEIRRLAPSGTVAIIDERAALCAVRDLLAEVDRLRAPDPQEERTLAKIRRFNWPEASTVAYLLARLDAAHNIVADLLADHDLIRQEGASAERERCLANLAELHRLNSQHRDVQDVVEKCILRIQSLPPLPPPSPPEAARRYAAALAACLEWFVHGFENTTNTGKYAHKVAEARKLLEEGY